MGEADVTIASSKLAKAQEVAALKGLRAAIPFYVEATDALANEKRYDAAVGVLAEVLNARKKKRSLFGSKQVNPLGPDRSIIAKQFAKMTRGGQVNDTLLELLSSIAVENPDDPDIRLANAEGLYRAGYMADAIDEYRYCEKLMPDDGALVARLGELYAIMSRNTEAENHLRRGIGELMQSHHFDEVPFFSLKLLEIEPQAAVDAQRWLESLPDATWSSERAEIERLLNAIRDKGLEDGRLASLEERLATLPPLEESAALDSRSDAAKDVAADFSSIARTSHAQATELDTSDEEPTAEPEPVWGAKAGNVTIGRTAWDDVSNVEPASEDEMRMLLGPSESTETQEEAAAAPAAKTPAPAATSANNGTVKSAPAPSAAPKLAAAPAGGGLPPGLAAFTRRKADAAFTAGDFAGAAQSYERLLKGGFDAEVATPLLECYLGTERFSEAAQLGLQLADHQAEAGDLDKAVETLALVLEHTSDPDVEQRHAELLAAK
jgi:tetratricopeptide (TPR) repeat protein